MAELRFDNKVVVVTGAGRGLGRAYAFFFASRGAKVVVNDTGGCVKGEGSDKKFVDEVVAQIKKNGGQAAGNYDSVLEGEKIIKFANDTFGKVDILINNAGIIRDISFMKITNKDWDLVVDTHLKGTYLLCKAAWNQMREAGYGRIINTASGSGLYGNFGQVNYSAAKLGIVGLSQALAKEGEKRNIFVNTIAPIAASRMTETVLPPDTLEGVKPEFVVPLVALLAHEKCNVTGATYEVAGGYIARVRWQRSEGSRFNLPFTPEEVVQKFEQINCFNRENDYPTSLADTLTKVNENIDRVNDLKAKL